MSKELSVIPAASVPAILAIEGAPDILKALAEELDAFKPDISTFKGRSEIASMAHKVAKSKMDLVRLANATTETWRASTKAVVAERTEIERRMDELKDRVRKPLTDFENEEKARIAGHERALADIVEAQGYGQAETSEELKLRLSALHSHPERDWQEFAQRAADTLASEIERTERLLTIAVKREEDAAELAALRAQAAEAARIEAIRVQAEHEERIAAEAAETARKAAEEKAAHDAKQEAIRAETERQRIEQEAKEARHRAEQAERDRLKAIEDAKQAAIEAAKNEAKAVEMAREEERRRIDEEQRAAELERRKREKNAAIRAKSMTAAKEALMEACGLDEETAKSVVRAIVINKIPKVSMEF